MKNKNGMGWESSITFFLYKINKYTHSQQIKDTNPDTCETYKEL